jgi:hypothetical protein
VNIFRVRVVRVLALAVLATTGLAVTATPAMAGPPSDGPRAQLRGLVEDVPGATRRYSTVDSTGRSMDTAKIIQDGPGQCLAPRAHRTSIRWR